MQDLDFLYDLAVHDLDDISVPDPDDLSVHDLDSVDVPSVDDLDDIPVSVDDLDDMSERLKILLPLLGIQREKKIEDKKRDDYSNGHCAVKR